MRKTIHISPAKRDAYKARCKALNSRFELDLTWQQFARAEHMLHALCEPDDLIPLEAVAKQLKEASHDSPLEWDSLIEDLVEKLHYEVPA